MKNFKLNIKRILFVTSLLCILSFGVSAYLLPNFNTVSPNPSIQQVECWWWCPATGWGSANVPCGYQCDQAILAACGGDGDVFRSCP